ncbi:MAG: hypothetical protein LBQ45_02350 [Mycoplasmataceae bacterium]|nr:hypothetical protein [Mycoplasmataceae bacterium]
MVLNSTVLTGFNIFDFISTWQFNLTLGVIITCLEIYVTIDILYHNKKNKKIGIADKSNGKYSFYYILSFVCKCLFVAYYCASLVRLHNLGREYQYYCYPILSLVLIPVMCYFSLKVVQLVYKFNNRIFWMILVFSMTLFAIVGVSINSAEGTWQNDVWWWYRSVVSQSLAAWRFIFVFYLLIKTKDSSNWTTKFFIIEITSGILFVMLDGSECFVLKEWALLVDVTCDVTVVSFLIASIFLVNKYKKHKTKGEMIDYGIK